MPLSANKKPNWEQSGFSSMLVARGGVEPPRIFNPDAYPGLIGPTRMPCERMIRIADITAKLVSNALSHHPVT